MTSLGKAEWSHSLGHIVVDIIAAGKLFPPYSTVPDYQGVTLSGMSSQISTSLGTLGLMNLISFGAGPLLIAPQQDCIFCNSTVVGSRKCRYRARQNNAKHNTSSLLWWLWPTQWHGFHGIAELNSQPWQRHHNFIFSSLIPRNSFNSTCEGVWRLVTSDLRFFQISTTRVSTRSLFISIHPFQRIANGNSKRRCCGSFQQPKKYRTRFWRMLYVNIPNNKKYDMLNNVKYNCNAICIHNSMIWLIFHDFIIDQRKANHENKPIHPCDPSCRALFENLQCSCRILPCQPLASAPADRPCRDLLQPLLPRRSLLPEFGRAEHLELHGTLPNITNLACCSTSIFAWCLELHFLTNPSPIE